MSTGPTLTHNLFNNNNKVEGYVKSCTDNCFVCRNGLLVNSGEVVSSISGIKYNVENMINAGCNDQYSGKTVHFGNRGKEHFTQVKQQQSVHIDKSVIGVMKEWQKWSIASYANTAIRNHS